MNLKFFGITCLLLIACAETLRAASTVITLEFNEDGVLPSTTREMDYVSSLNVVEESVFQASGGFLNMNSIVAGRDVFAFYIRSSSTAFNPQQPTMLDVRARVSAGTALAFTFANATLIGGFQLGPGSWSMPNGLTGTFGNPTDFHDFSIAVAMNLPEFEFRIDGQLAGNGMLSSFPGGNQGFWFGDATDQGGGVTADIDYVRYVNAVPEPSSLLLLVAGGMFAFGVVLRRRVDH